MNWGYVAAFWFFVGWCARSFFAARDARKLRNQLVELRDEVRRMRSWAA